MGYKLELEFGYLEDEEVLAKRRFTEIVEETGALVDKIVFESSYSQYENIYRYCVKILISLPPEANNSFLAHVEANKLTKEKIDPVLKKYELQIIRFNVESGK